VFLASSEQYGSGKKKKGKKGEKMINMVLKTFDSFGWKGTIV